MSRLQRRAGSDDRFPPRHAAGRQIGHAERQRWPTASTGRQAARSSLDGIGSNRHPCTNDGGQLPASCGGKNDFRLWKPIPAGCSDFGLYRQPGRGDRMAAQRGLLPNTGANTALSMLKTDA